ncbi:hypothetical protein JMJ58_20905 (plasmid) [Haloterrigena salifodinae]|uniref:Uncharacterized protein n=1 Tax=Haloterrigena salifodinae TaxID=2675099 RepID=A0A8T8E7G2_9EURY|nr:hypothetical protein [Haloterrigena salifodinae]QRV17420.1 hypothetical protein JMJ58_20905 [Haloterrigena salifodinae]
MTSLRSTAVIVTFLAVSGGIFTHATGVATAAPNSSTAVPDDGPVDRINETRFPVLWSEDPDHGDRSSTEFESDESTITEFSARLADSTDVSFEEPPEAVETWNSGDIQDFSPGDEERSVHPEGARLENGRYIRDAHASVFAVQPSTVLHAGNSSARYIAPAGEVLAITDYRVRVPDDDTNGSVRHQWSINETAIDGVELRTDDRVLDSDTSHRSVLEYSGLSGTQNLTVAVDISVRLNHKKRTCDEYDNDSNPCDSSWETETEYPTEQVTVTDSRRVVVNQFDRNNGKRVTFENANRTGAVIHPGAMWSTVDVDSDARLRGNWRFYSAGVDGWHTMVSRTETNTTQTNSSVRPAQVHAVPTQNQPDMPSEATAAAEPPLVIENVWGKERDGPSLSDKIDITPVDRYVNTTSVAVRSETLPPVSFDEMTVHGIVHGQSRTVSINDNGTVRDSNLELSVLEANASGAVVQTTVTEKKTGDPITTGRVTVGNQSAAVNASGMAVIELEERPSSVVDGQYTPEDWWRTEHLYSAAEARTTVPPEYPTFQKLVQLVLVTLLWFLPAALAVYGFDYLTDGAALGLRKQQ